MGIKVEPAELKRWQAAGLITPPATQRDRPPPPARGPGVRHHNDGDGGPGWRVVLTLPGVKLVSRSSERSHWSARHQRDKAEAAALTLAWVAVGLEGWCAPLPLAVILTRVGGQAMDCDNLGGAFKALRDRVASLVGIDDGDDRVRWRCRQRPGPAPLVRVTLAGRR